jgi:ribonuclease D
MRERTYFPRFCLLQLATESATAIVDPLSGVDLSLLEPLFTSPAITKIFHAAKQDLEVLSLHFSISIAPIFDTQVAAPFLGYPEQISYARLVQTLLDIEIDKGQSRTDWAARPLSQLQLDYARADVIHLGRLFNILKMQLAAIQRTTWVEEELAALEHLQFQPADVAQAWERIGGLHLLGDSALPALQSLAAWRECLAREQDLPRNWVVRDEVLIELCRREPADTAALQQIRGLEAGMIERHGKTLLACLASAGSVMTPPPRRTVRRSPEDTELLNRLMVLTRSISQETGIASSILATRRDLESFVTAPASSRLCSGWRSTVIGEALTLACQAVEPAALATD